MRKRMLSVLTCLVMVVSLLPTTAFAEGPSELSPAPAVYVNAEGNDESGNGSQENPYATLSKAVDAAEDGATIYVMSNLTMTKCARFYDKHLTITSTGETRVTITRGDNFAQQRDNARSTYNPAMIEVQSSTSSESVGLTLTNIVFDDNGVQKGTVFAQAISGEGKTDNTVYVQDAIIASNATAPCTITLGDGAVLRNFGGMSALRATDQAKIVMKDGSVIEDTLENLTRNKGTDTKSVGPAGAVWLQGGKLVMEKGSTIQNVNGRAVYADGGTVTISGTISGISANKNAMWQADNGTAIHLRNRAEGTLTSTAVIEDISGGGNAVYSNSCDLTAENGSVIEKCTSTIGIAVTGACKVNLDGEITGLTGAAQAINLNQGEFHVTIGKNAYIHDNEVGYGTIYIQAQNGKLDIYGKINNNIASDRGGGIAMANNYRYPTVVTMYDGAEICNNYSAQTGGGVMVSVGTFTMKGGTISDNIANEMGGGVYVRRGGNFIMEGGTISDNKTAQYGGGIAYEAKDYNGGVPCVTLKDGTVAGNTMSATIDTVKEDSHITKINVSGGVSNDISILNKDDVFSYVNRNLFISDDVTIGNKAVYFQTDNKTVTPADDSRDIKLGNTSAANVTTLTSASTAKSWGNPLATFWAQRDGAATLTVDGLTLSEMPVYVLALPVDENGAAETNADAQVYAATKGEAGTVNFTLPDISSNGYAIAIVQPTQDYGTLTISGPATLQENKTNSDYSVTYTVKYDVSDNMKNIIETAGNNATYNLAINKDTNLTGNVGTFNGNSIDVTYTLSDVDFAAGESLFASAVLTITVDGTNYTIPSNVAETKMVGLFEVMFDRNYDTTDRTQMVYVADGQAIGNQMPVDPTRSGYTFTGWNTKLDGTGTAVTKDTVVTGSLTAYAQWNKNSGGGSGSTTYYYFSLEKIDAQDSHTLNGAKFGLYLDGKQIATATSNSNGIATFRVDASSYRKIDATSSLYYQELIAPEGYIVSSDKIDIEKSDLTTSQTAAEKKAETVRNYRSSTPDLLNGDDHFAYVIGYEDGSVRPNGQISRAETATIFFRLLKDSVRDGNLLTSNTYTDVADNYWANTAISTMTGLGIVQGRSSTTFDPQAPITRAEFAAICARFDTGTSSGSQTFSDISGHWAEKYIQRAAELGWIKGFEDGSFRPNTYITRAEAMTMVNRVLNRIPEETSDLLSNMNVWPDCNLGDWFYLAVQEATNSHDFKHKAGNYETWTGMKADPDWTRYEN